MVFGVYINKRTGQLALMAKPRDYMEKDHWDFIWDKGEVKRHPFLRANFYYVQRGQGEYFFNKCIRNFEYLGEL